MKNLKELDLLQLVAYISNHLIDSGIECTLSGGACVSIYSNNDYLSKDLDFIENYVHTRLEIKNSMEKIGFIEKNRYFVHPDSEFFVEFPTGPLAVGSERITDIIEIEVSDWILRIISPTECVKDRLAAYYFWSDLECLNQAIMVSKSNIINFNEVKRWSEVENCLDLYNQFISKLIN